MKHRNKYHPKIVIIIPAYNESRSLPKLLQSILKHKNIHTCLVIDDGSSDGTADIAKLSGATVLKLPVNMGSGCALYKGIEYAHKIHADIVVALDADGQHDPKYIPLLLKHIQSDKDYIIASRYIKPTNYSTQKNRVIATKIIYLLFNKLLHITVHDPTSGYRAFGSKVLKELSSKNKLYFPEPEIILTLSFKGYNIHEVSVPMSPRQYGASTITLTKGIVLLLYIIIKILYFSITTHCKLYMSKLSQLLK